MVPHLGSPWKRLDTLALFARGLPAGGTIPAGIVEVFYFPPDLGVLGRPFPAACATHQRIPPGFADWTADRGHQGGRLGDDPPFLGGAHSESLYYGSYLTPHGMKGLIEPIYLGGTPPPCAARRGPRGCE